MINIGNLRDTLGVIYTGDLPKLLVIKSYRDKIYIIKDIIALLVEYGELNQTTLVSYCGLNLKKHKQILDNLESHGLISKSTLESGKRTVTIYKATNKGVEFCRTIIEPYEELFPRKTASNSDHKLGILIIV